MDTIRSIRSHLVERLMSAVRRRQSSTSSWQVEAGVAAAIIREEEVRGVSVQAPNRSVPVRIVSWSAVEGRWIPMDKILHSTASPLLQGVVADRTTISRLEVEEVEVVVRTVAVLVALGLPAKEMQAEPLQMLAGTDGGIGGGGNGSVNTGGQANVDGTNGTPNTGGGGGVRASGGSGIVILWYLT